LNVSSVDMEYGVGLQYGSCQGEEYELHW
jgi:hypothetical protein